MTEDPVLTEPGTASLEAVRVVLVRPQGAANVGAVARAMKNMGLSDLVMVAPRMRRRFLSEAMAVHARDVLQAAHTTGSLTEAVADCGLVIGTTCQLGGYRQDAAPIAELVTHILGEARRAPVAVVFGPEDHGLSNADLAACHRLVTVPTSESYASLNLAQAVLLCCYELRRGAAVDGREETPQQPPARAADVEFAFERLQAALLQIGFLNPQNPEHVMYTLRRIFGRAGLDERDVRILLGLARQIEWYGTEGWRRLPSEVSNG